MAGFKHGIGVTETPTALQSVAQVGADTPVIIGIAPIHLASDPAEVNTPVYCNGLSDAVTRLGYSDDTATYTLCEGMYAYFKLYNVAPVVFINVLDPTKHKKVGTQTNPKLTNKVATITEPVILSSLKITDTTSATVLEKDKDFTASYNDNGELVITLLSTENTNSTTGITVAYDQVDPAAVTKTDIIGGVDSATGQRKGLEAVELVFPYYRVVPGILLAPKFSTDSEVAMILSAKATGINACFNAMAYVDLPATEELKRYSDVPNYKSLHGYDNPNMQVHWPKVKLGSKIMHLSTLNAALTYYVNATQGGDVPYISPSNKGLQIDGACDDAGNDIMLSLADGNYLNGQGISTAMNWITGWVSWGNRTACYPANLDPKDNFNPLRRMANWIGATLINTYFSRVDSATTPRLTMQIVDTTNGWLAGLTAAGKLLGGRIEFIVDENPKTELIDGHIRFHLYLGYEVPAEYIEFALEYDTSYLSNLFQ